MRTNDLSPVLWKGRQWAVTDYGLETISEPYHYHLTVDQLRESGVGDRAGRYDSLIHLMEKNWLDVDDFATAFLVALALHGLASDADQVKASLRHAMQERSSLYGDGRAVMPGGIGRMSDMRPVEGKGWEGSKVLGVSVGGTVDLGSTDGAAPDDAES